MGEDSKKNSHRTDRRLYGRRRARPLRAGRRALLDELLPRLAFDLPEEGPVDPLPLFGGVVRDVWLEIGFGGGEHLAAQAAAHPEVGFVGAEVFVDGIASLLRHIQEQDLPNVRIYQGDGRELIQHLPASSIGRVFLLHPDPWPKRRHAERRFIQPDSLDQIARFLRPGGEFRIATDHATYLEWTLMKMAQRPDFTWTARRADDWRIRPDDWPATRYGAKAEREGRRCAYLRYVRK